MACSRQIGIIDIPIVCVNIDGYYDSFQAILQRAHEDQFLYKHPTDILHFEPTSQKAVEWIENYIAERLKSDESYMNRKGKRKIVRRQSMLKRMMFTFNIPSSPYVSLDDTKDDGDSWWSSNSLHYVAFFSAGLVLGLISSRKR